MAEFGGEVRGPTPEERAWQEALEDYMVQNPSDWIAKWMYGNLGDTWGESMYADVLREWYGSLPPENRRHSDLWWERRLRRGSDPFMPEPAWMGEMGLIAGRGEDIEGPFREKDFKAYMTEEYGRPGILGWPRPTEEERAPFMQYAPGQATGIRPLGAQANLTTEQLDQLLYYQAYIKGGKPESRKEYLETIAYKMPGWIQDYMSESQAGWPTKAAPKARISAAWQR